MGIGPEANIHTSLKIDSLVSSAETSKREKYTQIEKARIKGQRRLQEGNGPKTRIRSNAVFDGLINPLKPELNPICYLLALLEVHHFLHVSRIRVKSLTLRLLMSYIYGAPILDVSRSHTTTQHSR